MLPTISIVTPSFNQRDFVEKSLESVAAQSVSPVQHIVQDPGSTDGTREVLKSYAGRHPYVELAFEPDRGQANAINRAFSKCTGDIVTWLNTDDWYSSPDVLECVGRLFAEHPDVDFVHGRGNFVDARGKQIREAYNNAKTERLRHRFVNSVGILQPATFYRRSLLERVGLLDESLECAFDYELWVRFVKSGAKFHFLDRDLAVATFHEAAKSSSLRSRQLYESIKVTRLHYGFGSGEWIRRAAECDVAGRNGIVDAQRTPPSAEPLVNLVSEALFRRINGSKSTKAAILAAPKDPAYEKTRELATASGLLDASRVIVTAFDELFIDQGLTLIASIHRHQPRNQVILVYDLNLPEQLARALENLHNVFVVPFASSDVAAYPDFLKPKNYGYKCSAIWDARRFVSQGGSILWIDAGVSVTHSLDPIFSAIEQDGAFFVDHDDKSNWPFFNGTYTHPHALNLMNASREEMLAPHICSCLLGYKTDGAFKELFRQAREYALVRDIVVHDKQPELGAVDRSGLTAAAPNRTLLREWSANRRSYAAADDQQVRKAFGHLGHRQDQSIFSILAARHKAPYRSASYYCRSNSNSSAASKLHWASGGVSKEVIASADLPDDAASAITFHHRGTYICFEGLRNERRETDTLVVLGNGPSLKGFDFARFKAFDVIGMNAAYRYWETINWYPRYYICLDKVVGLSHQKPIEDLIRKSDENGIEMFFLRRNLIDVLAKDVKTSRKIVDFDAMRECCELLSPMPITTGSHAALLGAVLGYEQIVLMGIDCSYVERIAGAEATGGTRLELKVTPQENPNYFFEGYQVAGDAYNIPNPTPDLHINSWHAAAPVLAGKGIKVWNGSPQSKLDAFPFKDFKHLEREARRAAADLAHPEGNEHTPAMSDTDATRSDVVSSGAGASLQVAEATAEPSGPSQPNVVIFFPTLRTSEERQFWRKLVLTLRRRGYSPIVVSFLWMNDDLNVKGNHVIGCPRIFVPAPKLLRYAEDFDAYDQTRHSVLAAHQFDEHNDRRAMLDALVEALNLEEELADPTLQANPIRHARMRDDNSVGAEIFTAYLLNLISNLAPARVILNNDTLPIHAIARCCAEAVGVPVIHSERSPTVNRWFEDEGFYARSAVGQFLSDRSWAEPGPHEDQGRIAVERIRTSPSGHRSSEAGLDSSLVPAHAPRPRTLRRFLLPMDHVHNTGWTQPSHPASAENYPLFASPEESIRRLAAIARQFDARLVLKPHPADRYVRTIDLPDDVELVDGDLGTLIHECDVVLCFVTKVAFAALAQGKPVVTLAPNVAALTGLTFHCTSLEDIETQVTTALQYEFNDDRLQRLSRFLGYLDQHFFVANDLENDGAARLLNEHFPDTSERGVGARSTLDAATGDSLVMGLDAMAPDPTSDSSCLSHRSVLHGPYRRSRDRVVDEVDIVFELFRRGAIETDGATPLMLDVGACQGKSFAAFAQAGWAVHAFEANPTMYDLLAKRSKPGNVKISQLAVSDQTGTKVPFYTSEESVGISSMAPFRDTHRLTASVETIRLDDYCSQHGVTRVDFLKIDTEGFDLMVLKGLNWRDLPPRVVVCEFEDAKTESLGYRLQDLAQFLIDKGYQVFMSEWHPITRYGSGEHRWRAMHRWPSAPFDDQCWGNFIAFREPLAEAELTLATRYAVDRLSLRQFAVPARANALNPPAPKDLLGPFSRDHHVQFDEVALVAHVARNADLRGARHVMLDVGAHYGESVSRFANLGWTALAFEPDGSNRAKLERRFRTTPNVHVDSRAVSDRVAAAEPFFTSRESSGISGLSSFHQSHEKSGTVSTTTLGAVVREYDLKRIDVLKIDTEGFDLMVLKGLPWEVIEPGTIVCEFEDVKTVPLGYGFHDLAGFLVDRGYTVFVSEWHPIVRYGIRHDWRRLVRYPTELADPRAWGNLIAFKQPPSDAELASAAHDYLEMRPAVAAVKTNSTVAARAPMTQTIDNRHALPSPLRRTYVRFAEYLVQNQPMLARAGRFFVWTLRIAGRRPVLTAVAAMAITALLGGAVALPEARLPLLAAVAALSILAGVVLAGFFSRSRLLRLLDDRFRDVQQKIDTARNASRTESEATVRQLHALLSAQSSAIERSTCQLEEFQHEVSSQLAEALARIQISIKSAADAETAIKSARDDAVALRAEMSSLSAAVSSSLSTGTALEQTISQASERLGRLDRTVSKMASVNAVLYQRFNRSLGEESLARMEKWAKLLGLNLSPRALGYMAHRICSIENACTGRLATSIEAAVLRALVARSVRTDDLAIMEIGTLFGIGAGAIYDVCRPHFETVHLSVIDPFDGYYGTENLDVLTGIPVTEREFRDNMKRLLIPDEDLTIIREFSQSEAAQRETSDCRYDVLVIDGDHSGEGVTRDAELYCGRVTSGGYVIFDDYGNPDWPEIKPAVDTFTATRPELELVVADWNTAVYRVAGQQVTEF